MPRCASRIRVIVASAYVCDGVQWDSQFHELSPLDQLAYSKKNREVNYVPRRGAIEQDTGHVARSLGPEIGSERHKSMQERRQRAAEYDRRVRRERLGKGPALDRSLLGKVEPKKLDRRERMLKYSAAIKPKVRRKKSSGRSNPSQAPAHDVATPGDAVLEGLLARHEEQRQAVEAIRRTVAGAR